MLFLSNIYHVGTISNLGILILYFQRLFEIYNNNENKS